MNIGSMKEVFLSNARDVFLFDCQAAGLDPQIRYEYREVLASFTRFTGNILVKDLTPNHVHAYIGNLADGPSEGEEHIRSVKNHYAVIYTWIRWLDAQKFITERGSGFVRPSSFDKYLLIRFINEEPDTLLADSTPGPTGHTWGLR